jgi:hypothetical protein
MDNVPFFPPFLFLLFGLAAGLVQFAWYVAATIFLYKIWQKVKHLPS